MSISVLVHQNYLIVVGSNPTWQLPIRFLHQTFHEVAQGPQKSLFDRMVEAGKECSRQVLDKLPEIADRAGIQTDYGKGKFLEDAVYTFDRDLPDLEISNEDWDSHLKFGTRIFERGPAFPAEGLRAVKKEYRKILERVEDSLLYRCDRHWGFEGREEMPPERGDVGGRLAEKLLEILREPQEELFRRIGDEARFKERFACKQAVKGAIASFDLCIRSKVPEQRT